MLSDCKKGDGIISFFVFYLPFFPVLTSKAEMLSFQRPDFLSCYPEANDKPDLKCIILVHFHNQFPNTDA